MVRNLESRLADLKDRTDVSSERNVKSSKFSYIDPEVVIGLLESGLRMPQIGEIYGCSFSTVKYQCMIKMPNFNARKHLKWGKWEITVEQVVEMYKELPSCTKIAKILGVNTHAITERLDKAGVARRPLWREDVTQEKVVELYEIHKSVSKVAEILGTNNGLIGRRLKDAGVPIYPRNYKIETRTDIPDEGVCEFYDKGDSIASIARNYKASHWKIRKILVKNNREIRKKG